MLSDQPAFDVQEQIQQLSERLGRVERLLGLSSGAVAGPGPAQPARPEPRESAVTPAVAPTAPVPAHVGAPSAPIERPQFVRRPMVARADARREGGEAKRHSALSIEKVIGAKLFAALGAVAIGVGAVLFLKFAYDRGWLGQLSPTARCALAAMFGFALLGAGGIARRRINAMAAAGFLAAGLGVLYATVYAAHAQWKLVTDVGGVSLLIAVSALGLGVGSVTGLASVTGFALVVGYVSPVVFGNAAAQAPLFLPPYLLTLFVVGLALSWWKGGENPRFHRLRRVCWIGTGGLGSLWLLAKGLDMPALATLFILAVWGLTHLERVLALRGVFGGREEESEEAGTRRSGGAVDGWSIAGSFSATVWATAFGAWVVERGLEAPSWLAPAALLFPTSTLGFMLAGHLRALRDTPRDGRERFGAGLLIQAGGLVLTVVALALSGWAQALAWVTLGVAAIAAGRWIVSRALDVYGIVALAFATVRLAALIVVGNLPGGAGETVFGLHVDFNSARVALTGIAWLVGAALMARDERFPLRAWVASFAGFAVLAAVPDPSESQVGSLCVWWAALALGAGGAERMSGARVRWAPAGGALLVVAALAWAAEYPLGFWGATSAPVGLHPGLWIAALIGGAAIILAWRLAKPAQSAVVARVVRWVCAAGVLVIMFTATSFEVARWASLWAQDAMARQGALSIYWGLFAVGLLIAGFRRGVPAARYCGLALLGTAGVKAVVIDLSSAPPEWRIASFTALGLLMVGVAAGYARVAGRLGGRGERDSGDRSAPGVEAATEPPAQL